MADDKNPQQQPPRDDRDNKDAKSGEPVQLDKDQPQQDQGNQAGGQQQGAQHGSQEGGHKR